MNFFFGYNTVKSHKHVSSSTSITNSQDQFNRLANSKLDAKNLKLIVQLPEGEDLNEWLALNCVDFFNQLGLLNGTVRDFCTPDTCPIMNAGPKYEFHWCDGVKYKRPVKLCATEYIQHLLEWIKGQIDDEGLFPTKNGVSFNLKKFPAAIKVIFKRMSRIYGHLYFSHFQVFKDSNVDSLLNSSFKHFIYFAKQFDLLCEKDLLPLLPLLAQMD